MSKKEKFFIQRPHAVDQYRTRAKALKRGTAAISFERAEQELRHALEDLDMAGELKTALRASKNDGEFVVRIAVPQREVVYALLVPGKPDGKYEYMVPTIFDQEMYQQWNQDGKLGTVADVAEEEVIAKLAPAIKPTLYLRYKNGQGQYTPLLEYTTDDISHQIAQLLKKNVRFEDIQVFRKVDFSMSINIGIADK
jgi:hypothetical protein